MGGNPVSVIYKAGFDSQCANTLVAQQQQNGLIKSEPVDVFAEKMCRQIQSTRRAAHCCSSVENASQNPSSVLFVVAVSKVARIRY